MQPTRRVVVVRVAAQAADGLLTHWVGERLDESGLVFGATSPGKRIEADPARRARCEAVAVAIEAQHEAAAPSVCCDREQEPAAIGQRIEPPAMWRGRAGK